MNRLGPKGNTVRDGELYEKRRFFKSPLSAATLKVSVRRAPCFSAHECKACNALAAQFGPALQSVLAISVEFEG